MRVRVDADGQPGCSYYLLGSGEELFSPGHPPEWEENDGTVLFHGLPSYTSMKSGVSVLAKCFSLPLCYVLHSPCSAAHVRKAVV